MSRKSVVCKAAPPEPSTAARRALAALRIVIQAQLGRPDRALRGTRPQTPARRPCPSPPGPGERPPSHSAPSSPSGVVWGRLRARHTFLPPWRGGGRAVILSRRRNSRLQVPLSIPGRVHHSHLDAGSKASLGAREEAGAKERPKRKVPDERSSPAAS